MIKRFSTTWKIKIDANTVYAEQDIDVLMIDKILTWKLQKLTESFNAEFENMGIEIVHGEIEVEELFK